MLQENTKNGMDTESKEHRFIWSNIQLKDNFMQKLIRRKLGLFGHICRMHNNKKIKELVFGRMEGTNKRGS